MFFVATAFSGRRNRPRNAGSTSTDFDVTNNQTRRSAAMPTASDPATKPKRLGVFGGSFDPVHWGHLLLAETCRDECSLEEVWFLPCGQPPHKPAGMLTAGRLRAEMLELAVAGDPRFGVCRIELDRSGPSYTVDTLR